MVPCKLLAYRFYVLDSIQSWLSCQSYTEKLENNVSMTGGAYDFERATISVTQKLMSAPKKVTIVRHGLSSWNEESRVQVCCLNFFLSFFFPFFLGSFDYSFCF